jgi:hypothetical protein
MTMSRKKADPQIPTPVPRELQQMWLHLVRETWSSLAVVPTDPGTSARSITAALTEMASFYDLGDIKIIDAQGASLQDGVRLAQDVTATVAKGGRVVVAVDSPMHNGGAMPLVMAAGAAILLVRLGTSHLQAARSIVDIVGRERILGAIALEKGALAGLPGDGPRLTALEKV